MSNLQSAISQAALRAPSTGVPVKSRSKLQVAKRVFQLAAAGGFPYTGMSFQQWAKKWLTSDTFKLMEIDINAAASPHLPRNPERVAFRLLCGVESVDPIVVDLNKQKTGKSHLGYIPKIVVLDGKHRKQAQMLNGHTRILAWVGCKAEKGLQNAHVIDKLDFTRVTVPLTVKQPSVIIQASHLKTVRDSHNTPFSTSFNLHCATVPSTGQAMVDQSGGEAGSRPRGAIVRSSHDKNCKCSECRKDAKKDFSPVSKMRDKLTMKVNPKTGELGMPKQVRSQGGAGSAGGMGSSLGSGSGSNPAMNIKSGGPGSGRHKSATADEQAEHNAKVRADLLYPVVHKKSDTPTNRFGKNLQIYQNLNRNPMMQTWPKRTKKMKAKDSSMCACHTAPKSMGVIDDASASDEKIPPDASDAGSRTEASDQRKYLFPMDQIKAPGAKGWEGYGPDSQNGQAPGTGVGPRTKRSTGGSRSEMSRLADTVVTAGSKLVKSIYTKAPPGKEKMVLDLKKKYGADSSTPFKIAWSQYEKEMEARGQ